VTLSEIFPPAVALTEEAQGECLAEFLFREVASKRFTHQRGHGNPLVARQGMDLVVHRFFYKKCGSFHMAYSSIRWVRGVSTKRNGRGKVDPVVALR